MIGYKNLLAEKNFLKVKIRAMRLSGTFIEEIYYNRKDILFKTRSGTDPRMSWYQTIRIEDLKSLEAASHTKDLDEFIRNSSLKIHCFIPGTEVLTSVGYVPIESIKVGDRVFSHKGILRKVLRTYESDATDLLALKVGTSKHDVVVGTAGHPFLVENNKWVKASDLTVGDSLTMPILSLDCSKKVDNRLAFLLGLYLADGNLAARTVKSARVRVTECLPIKRDGYNIGRLSIALHSECSDWYKKELGELICGSDETTLNGGHLYINDYAAREFCLNNGNFTSKSIGESKRVNPEILNWDKGAKEELLRGFFLGDGSLVGGSGEANDAKSAYLVFYNTNKNIMDLVYTLLATMVPCHFYKKDRKPFVEHGKLVNPKQMYCITVSAHYTTWLIKNVLKGVETCKGHFLETLEYAKYSIKDNDGIFKVPLRGINKIEGTSKVYNLEVEEDESYIVKGVAVHNCTCPAWHWWGFKYMAWKGGYGLEKETHRPKVRNPLEQGMVCFPGHMRVLTSDGYKNISDIKIGDLVYTHKGRLRHVTDLSCIKAYSTVSLRVGSKWIESTENHPSLSYRNPIKSVNSDKIKKELIQYNEAGSLSKGDFLFGTKLKNTTGTVVGAKYAYALGLYLSDGNMYGKEVKTLGTASFKDGNTALYGISIACDRNRVNFVKALLEGKGITVDRVYDNLKNTPSLVIKDRELLEFCCDYGNHTKKTLGEEKKLDSRVLDWCLEDKLEFLRGFFLGDGTFVEGAGKVGNNTSYITYFNTNKDIMEKIHLLLREFYYCNLSHYDRKDFTQNGRVVKCKRMYYVRVTGSDVKDLSNILTNELLAKGGWNSTKRISNKKKFEVDGLLPMCIKERKDTLYSDGISVYNMSVDEDSTYIVEGTIQHNCKHLYLVAQVYPFLAKTIAMKMRKGLAEEASKPNRNSAQDARKAINTANKLHKKEIEAKLRRLRGQ